MRDNESGQEERNEWVFGRRPVWEVLQAGKRALHKLWVAEGIHGVEDHVRLAREKGVPIEISTQERLNRLMGGGPVRHHQGIVAQVSATTFQELEAYLQQLAPGSPALVVGLDEIQDPQNVGAILRSAGFFGVGAALVPRWRSAPVGETAWRVSAGAAERVTMIRVRNLVDAMEKLKEAGFEVLGADMSGEPAWDYTPGSRIALIVGSEGKGLRRLVREHCDKLIGIPAAAGVDSLNVATATGILLYELSRRRNNLSRGSSTGRAPVL